MTKSATILEVQHENYTELVIVNEENLIQTRELIKDKVWGIKQQGSFKFTTKPPEDDYVIVTEDGTGRRSKIFREC